MHALIESSPGHRYSKVEASKSGGVTYTPAALADFVADQMVRVASLPQDRPVRVLDPAVGQGALLESLLARIPGEVEVFGFDPDRAALAVAEDRLRSRFPRARLHLAAGSFLDEVSAGCAGDLFDQRRHHDLIIANPPYVRTQIIGAANAQALATRFGLEGRVDLSFAFLLAIARALAPDGTAGVITSNRFMTTRAGEGIRAALTRDLALRHVFDLGDTKLFDAAVLPAVLIANARSGAARPAPLFTTIYEGKAVAAASSAASPLDALHHAGPVAVPDGRTFTVEHGELHEDLDPAAVWRLTSPRRATWLNTVEAHSWGTFGDLGKIRVGVKTCADKVFIGRKWPESLELLRPLTTHRAARRYRADRRTDTSRILYPHASVNGRRVAVDLAQYPASRAYLEAHRAQLESRTYVIEGGRQWFELWVPQNPADWQGPKLVFRDICERPTFWIDQEDTIVNGDCYWLKPVDPASDMLWLAVAVANSTFIERFYDRRFNNKLYSGRRRFITQYVEHFPLPDPHSDRAREIIRCARLIYDQVDQPCATALEREVDALVWAAFGVSPEEG